MPSMSQNVLMIGKMAEDPPLIILRTCQWEFGNYGIPKQNKTNTNTGEYGRKRPLV